MMLTVLEFVLDVVWGGSVVAFFVWVATAVLKYAPPVKYAALAHVMVYAGAGITAFTLCSLARRTGHATS